MIVTNLLVAWQTMARDNVRDFGPTAFIDQLNWTGLHSIAPKPKRT